MSNDDGLRILASTEATQRLSRRAFLAGATVTAVAGTTLISACGSSTSTATPGAGSSAGPIEDQLNMYTWGEYDAPKVLKEFTAEVGPKLQVDSYNSNEEMIAKLVAAKGTSGFDLVVPTGPFIPQMVANNLLDPIDLTRLTNFSNVDEVYLGQSWDPNNEHSVPKAWGTTGYAYDTTKIDREMTTWQDFNDVATTIASGQVSILDSPDNVVALYLWAKDQDWMTTDMALLDEAQDYLVNTMAPHVKKFESYPGSNGMPQGSFWLCHAWNGDARQGILSSDNASQWKWVLPGPRTEIWMDNWCIPTGAPQPNAAYAWIDYVLDPAVSLKELSYIGYHTAIKDIEPAAKAAGLDRLDIVFFTPEQVATMEAGVLNDAQQKRVEIWQAMKAAAGR